MIKPNFSLIRQHASDAVRYARNKDNRVIKSLTAFYEEGKNAPGYANLMLIEQLNANIKTTSELLQSQEISLKESFKYNDAPGTTMKITNQFLSDKYNEFQKAYKSIYPKTSAKREAIQNYLAAYDVTARTPVKNKKGFKKFFTMFFTIKDKLSEKFLR